MFQPHYLCQINDTMKVLYVIIAVGSVFVFFNYMSSAESAPQQLVAIGFGALGLLVARFLQAEFYGNKQAGDSIKDVFIKKD